MTLIQLITMLIQLLKIFAILFIIEIICFPLFFKVFDLSFKNSVYISIGILIIHLMIIAGNPTLKDLLIH